jgi:hypothetical protein
MASATSLLPTLPDEWDDREIQEGQTIKTHSYFSPDEVSSAAQKSVRRGMAKESVQWFLELFWTNKNRRTNILNRALIMAIEDIGPANPWLLVKLIKQRRALYPEKTEWTPPQLDDAARTVAAMAYDLALSGKSRVNDWAVCAHRHVTDKNVVDLIGAKEKLSEAIEARESNDVVYWLVGIVRSSSKNSTGEYVSPQTTIWEVYDEYMTGEYYTIIKNYFLNKDNWRGKSDTLLVFIHLWHMYINDCLPKEKYSQISVEKQELDELITAVLEHRDLVPVPDYAIDKHTLKGASSGRGAQHFIEEGSKIENEDLEWKDLSDYYFEWFSEASEVGDGSEEPV